MAEIELEEKNTETPSGATSEELEVVYKEFVRVMISQSVFLLPVESVMNVIRPTSLTPVLMAPAHLMGLANVRGQIFCMIDPGKALGLSQKRNEKSENARFVLLRHPRVNLGIWVEEVARLYRVREENVLPEVNNKNREAGKVKVKDEELPILRVDALFD